LKNYASSSHARIMSRVNASKPLAIADLGCGNGYLSREFRSMGHHVTGIDAVHSNLVDEHTGTFILADLSDGLPKDLEGPFDLIVLADILEHLRHPEVLLRDLHAILGPGGTLLISVPNFAHWYPRARVLVGKFGYDKRGILDEDHVRFFTRSSISKLLKETAWEIKRREAIGTPWEELLGASSKLRLLLRTLDNSGLLLMETMFAYQFLLEAVEQSNYKASPKKGTVPDNKTGTPSHGLCQNLYLAEEINEHEDNS
jgi:SAM-dependent methyltransferase